MRGIGVVFFLGFTLYPARSRVGRGNLVLRRSVPYFPLDFRGLCGAVQVADLNAEFMRMVSERRNGNINQQ